MRRLPRIALMLLATAGLALGAGCKSPCRQLTEKQCDCASNSVEKENCVQRAQRLESNAKLTEGDNARCQALLDAKPGCDCKLVDTAEGKERCGLARPTE